MFPASLLGLALLLLYWFPVRWRIEHGVNDFLNLYSGALLIGTPGQFDPARYRDVQVASSGFYGEAFLFTRLPAIALALRPLGRMPYHVAYAVWQSLSFAALAGFILLWQTGERALLVLICCWSFPLSAVFASGQDDNFLLLWLALALLLQRKYPALAGVTLALGAMKFHLFVLIPVALLAGRRWSALCGFLGAAAAVFALCFVAAGPRWLDSYLQLVLNPVVNPKPGVMPNLHGLVYDLPLAATLEILASLLVLAIVWRLASVSSFPTGIAAAIAGGILVSRHAYNADLVLLIPALLLLCREMPTRTIRGLSASLLAPICLLLPAFIPLLVLALLITAAGQIPPLAARSKGEARSLFRRGFKMTGARI